MAKKTPADQVRSTLEWLYDHNQEDRRVTVGCRTCRETHNLLVATALTAWLNIHDQTHEVWVKNPFRK